jgi:septal ring factor EnvC (AmiA/AmiB activator)
LRTQLSQVSLELKAKDQELEQSHSHLQALQEQLKAAESELKSVFVCYSTTRAPPHAW